MTQQEDKTQARLSREGTMDRSHLLTCPCIVHGMHGQSPNIVLGRHDQLIAPTLAAGMLGREGTTNELHLLHHSFVAQGRRDNCWQVRTTANDTDIREGTMKRLHLLTCSCTMHGTSEW